MEKKTTKGFPEGGEGGGNH
jgi:hypothetical protein